MDTLYQPGIDDYVGVQVPQWRLIFLNRSLAKLVRFRSSRDHTLSAMVELGVTNVGAERRFIIRGGYRHG